jgi:hypothetical protein
MTAVAVARGAVPIHPLAVAAAAARVAAARPPVVTAIVAIPPKGLLVEEAVRAVDVTAIIRPLASATTDLLLRAITMSAVSATTDRPVISAATTDRLRVGEDLLLPAVGSVVLGVDRVRTNATMDPRV